MLIQRTHKLQDLFPNNCSLTVRVLFLRAERDFRGHLSHPRIRNIIPGRRLELNFKRARVAPRYYATFRESIS